MSLSSVKFISVIAAVDAGYALCERVDFLAVRVFVEKRVLKQSSIVGLEYNMRSAST